MITLYIIAGLCFLVGIMLTRQIIDGFSDLIFLIPAIAGASFLIAILVGALMTLAGMILTDHDKLTSQGSFEIIAAADGSLTEGNFFIFGGQIEEEPMYFFYRQDANGGIRQGHVPVNDSVIYEAEQNKGYIEVFKGEDYDAGWYFMIGSGDRKYEIYVPKGSVVRTFDFDLEK